MYNIILITVDALRPDHLSCYGYKHQTSKNLDTFSKKAIIFKNAFCCINTTDPSFTSLFTGKEPHNHGINNHGKKLSQKEIEGFNSKDIKWLTSILKKQNYTTVGIDWLGRWHRRDFDEYPFQLSNFFDDVLKKNEINRDCNAMTDEAIKWLEILKSGPFFLFIHYWDLHAPYNYRSKRTIKKFPHIKKLGSENNMKIYSVKRKIKKIFKRYYSYGSVSEYDAAMFNVDHQISRIFKLLKLNNLIEKTIVIITADHGESLGEHGIYDHHGLYDVSIRIPLIIYLPDLGHKIIDSFVQTTDIMPTLLELLNISFEEKEFDGFSLLSLITRKNHCIRNKIFVKETFWENKFAIRTKKYKLIIAKNEKEAMCRSCRRIHGDGLIELYDLEKDPNELNNIYLKQPTIVNNLKQEIIAHFGKDYHKVGSLDDEEKKSGKIEEQKIIEKKLEDLGYI